MRVHILYVLGAAVLATATFFIGRRTGQQSELREIASDPKMVEAAKAINALDEWKNSIQRNSQDVEKAEAERKAAAEAEAAAEAAAEAKRQRDATDTVQNQDVRIHLDKFYRGKVLARGPGLGDDSKDRLSYDCLLVKYKVDNTSQASLLDAFATEAVDSFGNKLDAATDYSYSDVLRLLALDDLNTERIGPGESKYRYAVFKQPLPNAEWYILKMFVGKANGDMSHEPLYLKATNSDRKVP